MYFVFLCRNLNKKFTFFNTCKNQHFIVHFDRPHHEGRRHGNKHAEPAHCPAAHRCRKYCRHRPGATSSPTAQSAVCQGSASVLCTHKRVFASSRCFIFSHRISSTTTQPLQGQIKFRQKRLLAPLEVPRPNTATIRATTPVSFLGFAFLCTTSA